MVNLKGKVQLYFNENEYLLIFIMNIISLVKLYIYLFKFEI